MTTNQCSPTAHTQPSPSPSLSPSPSRRMPPRPRIPTTGPPPSSGLSPSYRLTERAVTFESTVFDPAGGADNALPSRTPQLQTSPRPHGAGTGHPGHDDTQLLRSSQVATGAAPHNVNNSATTGSTAATCASGGANSDPDTGGAETSTATEMDQENTNPQLPQPQSRPRPQAQRRPRSSSSTTQGQATRKSKRYKATGK